METLRVIVTPMDPTDMMEFPETVVTAEFMLNGSMEAAMFTVGPMSGLERIVQDFCKGLEKTGRTVDDHIMVGLARNPPYPDVVE